MPFKITFALFKVRPPLMINVPPLWTVRSVAKDTPSKVPRKALKLAAPEPGITVALERMPSVMVNVLFTLIVVATFNVPPESVNGLLEIRLETMALPVRNVTVPPPGILMNTSSVGPGTWPPS